MEPSDGLPPTAKWPKLSREHSGHDQGTENAEKTPALRQPLLKAEFPLHNLEDFYKRCPSYRLPLEIGAFSINGEGELCLDRSQLRYYAPPGRLNLDMKVGFDCFVPKEENCAPTDRLQPILKWISNNGNCFRPKSAHLKSPDKNGEIDSSSRVLESKDRCSVHTQSSIQTNPSADHFQYLEVIRTGVGLGLGPRLSHLSQRSYVNRNCW